LAFYVRDPHVVVGLAPQELFLDPAHTYRLWLATYRASKARPRGFTVRRLRTMEDAEATNRIYSSRDMVTVQPPTFLNEHRRSRVLTYFVAVDRETDDVIGTVTGIDHVRAFGDPEQGSSLWCLAVDPQTSHPGVGLALVQQLAEHYVTRGRAFMDLSVMHHNTEAIGLYEKIGFQRVQVFCVKHKNPINEQLFVGPTLGEEMNPYAMIIVNEARRRGISVDVHNASAAVFSLSYGGRTIRCRESLSDLTNAVGMTICDDKELTHEFLAAAGVRVPLHRRCGSEEENVAFLEEHGRIVVKPVCGEQGVGISVDVRTPRELEAALGHAESACERVLIDKQSRRRAAATGGESAIPVDDETERCVRLAGHTLDDVLPPAETILVRKTANVHTGGTIHDVTADLHPALADAAVTAARALQMPVVGLDLIVPAVDQSDYVVVEANERPGLANHEPQPTAERFIDLLFPQTAIR
jgi:GNAT-family acetyltransferase (TIGR03103 family)